MVRSQKVISSIKNNDNVNRNNEVGIFRALQVEQSSLNYEWEIMMEREIEVKLSRALNSTKQFRITLLAMVSHRILLMRLIIK